MERAIEAEDDAAKEAIKSLEECFAAIVVSLEEYFAAMVQRHWRNASRSQACRWRSASRPIVTPVQYDSARSIMDSNIAHTLSRKVKYEYESMGYECNYVWNGIV
ncbi:hypothetical protein PV326_009844 [Microctonus aethiopoides]|nr:hypothetical protein PV326_009844 [Microctonus aethiopoides]